MDLRKLSNWNAEIEEIKTILSAKLKDFNIYARISSKIVYEQGETTHYYDTVDRLYLYIGNGTGSNFKKVEIYITTQTVNLYLSGLKLLAKNYDGNNFVDYINQVNCA